MPLDEIAGVLDDPAHSRGRRTPASSRGAAGQARPLDAMLASLDAAIRHEKGTTMEETK